MAVEVSEIARTTNRMRYTPTGGQLVRTFAVVGMDRTLSDNGVRAISYVNGFDPSTQYQAPHPTVVGFYCGGFESEIMGNDQSPNLGGIIVYVMYGTPEFIPNAVQIEIQGLTGTKEINFWPTGPLIGTQMLVGAWFGDGVLIPGKSFDNQIDPASAPEAGVHHVSGSTLQTVQYDPISIPVLSGGLLLTYTRREGSPPNFNFKRKVNSTAWNGLGPGLWLCYQISSRNLVSVSTLFPAGGWQTTYIFQSADNLDLPAAVAGFKVVEFFKDTITGKPMVGADILDGTNNGYTIIDPYNSANFNSLGLPAVY